MKIPRTRKQSAPRNIAAKALHEGQFQPKIEKDPKAYSRKRKHRGAELPEENGESEKDEPKR